MLWGGGGVGEGGGGARGRVCVFWNVGVCSELASRFISNSV